jgi:hypothetical protein
MRAHWTAWGLCLLCTVASSAGCEDEGKPEVSSGRGASGNERQRDAGPIDAGPLDAGVALEELGLDGARLVSELSAEEAQQLCQKLDDVTTLLDDLEQACTVEAYLITFDAVRCDSIVAQCVDNGATVLGLELELPCAGEPLAIAGCDAPVNDVLACAVQLGDFWAERVCETEALADLGPLCPRALASDCPALFGSD